VSRLVPTRWSHLLGYSGVGAIVRADHDLFVVEDTRQWTDRAGNPEGAIVPYVDLLRATLQIDRELREPPRARELPNAVVDGVCVPAVRFPRWMRCPACGLLHWRPRGRPWGRPSERPWASGAERGEAEGDARPRCGCGPGSRLQQVGWVLAYRQGGLAEVPWHLLAHRDAGTQQQRGCRSDRSAPHLKLHRASGGGTGWRLTCGRCRARAPFAPGRPWSGGDPTRQPWQRLEPGHAGDVSAHGQILEVNDPRLHFPRTRSALVIPPESRVRRGSVLDRLYSNREHRDRLDRARTPLARASALRTLASHYACAKDQVEAAWEEIQRGYPLYGESVTPGGLLAREYRALIEDIPDLADGEDFVPRHRTAEWKSLAASLNGKAIGIASAVDRLSALTRLREVRIFTGFTRITQNADDGMRPVQAPGDQEPPARLVPPDLDGTLDWLPAIELYGEGIFFTLDEGMLASWAQQPGLGVRIGILQRRFEHTGIRFPDAPIARLTPRFVLLHTLAHLLIRQLETQAGYPAASIRERIYCAECAAEGGPMAGILVYVAVPDIAGSLGGLSELAEPARFAPLLASVFAHAHWCSLDPVCVEHEGQGPSQLNLGACHACALLPEPSCQFGNVLLDRAFVRGDLQGEIRPLLDFARPAR